MVSTGNQSKSNLIWALPVSVGTLPHRLPVGPATLLSRRLGVTGWSDPRESCLAISAHHSEQERRLHHHDEAARHWLPIFPRFRRFSKVLLGYYYLCRIKRKYSSCSAWLNLSGTPSLAMFLPFFDLWSRPLGVTRLLLGLHGFPPRPIPRKGSVNTTTTLLFSTPMFLQPEDVPTDSLHSSFAFYALHVYFKDLTRYI